MAFGIIVGGWIYVRKRTSPQSILLCSLTPSSSLKLRARINQSKTTNYKNKLENPNPFPPTPSIWQHCFKYTFELLFSRDFKYLVFGSPNVALQLNNGLLGTVREGQFMNNTTLLFIPLHQQQQT